MRRIHILTDEKLETIIRARLDQASKEASRGYEMDILMKQANILSLQSQINPHFLYNALECIRGQALLDGAEAIADMTHALSHFFRYSISSKSAVVTLAGELENAQNYVTIQQYRFRNRFTFSVEGAEEDGIRDVVLPKMTLQPLVENVILHGFSDIVTGGRIAIRLMRSDKNVSITVSDNGKGIEPEALNRYQEMFNRDKLSGSVLESAASGGTGIGLYNVDRRIKLYFGNDYGLSITSCPGRGTDVNIFFPFMHNLPLPRANP